MPEFAFDLNTSVEDYVTGLKGIITARAEYIDRPNHYLIESMDSTERPIETWFPEDRISPISGSGRSFQTGRWERVPMAGMLCCTVCGSINPAKTQSKFCPNCGALMKVIK